MTPNKNWFIPALVLLLCHLPVKAEDISYKWKVDQVYYVDVVHAGSQEISLPNQKTASSTTIHFVFKVQPTKIDPDGTVTLDHTIIICDSSSTTNNGVPDKDVLKGLRDQQFQVKLSPGNKTVEIVADLPKLAVSVFADQAANAKPAEAKFLQDMVGYILQLHLDAAYFPTPAKDVSVGDKWAHAVSMKLQPLCELKADREYTVEKSKQEDGKDVGVISWTSQLDMKALKDDSGVFPFTIKELTPIDKQRDFGSILWDATAGHPVKVNSEQHCQMEMLMEIGGNSIKASGKTDDVFVTRFMDKAPEK